MGWGQRTSLPSGDNLSLEKTAGGSSMAASLFGKRYVMWIEDRWWIEGVHGIHNQATSPFFVEGVQVNF